jgi:putative FmdB family regulatory protein
VPTYDFLCGKCNARFEVLVRSGKRKVVCKKCGSKKVSRQVTSFGMNLGAAQPKGFGKNGSICGCGASGCAPCSAGL